MSDGYLPPVVAKLAADVSDLQRGMAQARAEMRATADDGGRSFDRLKGVGTVALHALVLGSVAAAGALAGIGAFGLKAAADMQQVDVAFQGIMGSSAAANQFLGELKKFAAATPFEFPELATAAKQLMATGTAAADVIPVMTKIGNVAATLGVGAEGVNSVVRALGQMQGKGKISAEELNQIGEAIPGFSAIGAIAQGMGVSVSEAFDKVSTGAVPAGQGIQYILDGMAKFPGAAGAMERQSQTLNGVLSTMKDTLRDNLVAGLQPVLPLITKTLNDAQGLLGTSIAGISGALGALIPPVLGLLQAVLPIASSILGAFGTVFGEVGARLAALLNNLAPYIDRLLDSLLPLISAFLELASDVLMPILPVILEIADSLADALLPVFRALDPIIRIVAQTVATFFQRLNQTGILQRLGALLGRVLDALMPLLPPLQRLIFALLDALTPVLDQVLLAFEALLPALPPLVDSLVHLLDAMLPLMPVMVQMITLGTELLVPLAQLVALLMGPLSAAITWIADRLGELILWLVNAKDTVVRFVSEIPGAILGFLGSIASAAYQVGQGIVQGIIDGINSLAGFFGNIGETILSGIKTAWNTAINIANDLIPNSIGMPWPIPDIDLPDNPFNFARLAKGGLAFEPFMALIGDNPDAATNPEVVSPVSLMASTFARVLDAKMARVGAGGGDVTVVIVRSEEEALEYVPEGARPKTRAAFLDGRKAS